MATELATAYVSLVPSFKGGSALIAKELGAPLQAASAQAGAKSATAVAGGFSSKLGSLAKGATLPFIGIGVAAIASAKSVEDAQNTILRTTGATGKAADGLLDSFKNVAKGSAASFGTVAETLSEVSQRTGLTGKNLEGLTSQIVSFNRITKDSPIGVQDLTKAFAGFNVPAGKTSATLDKLFTISQKTGVPLADLVSTLGTAGPILRQFNFPVEQAASIMAKLDKAGVPAAAAMGGLRKAFITFAKEGKDPKEALVGVLGQIDQFVKAGNKVAAQKLGAQIFGARGVGLVDAAIQGKLSIKDLTATVSTSGKGIVATAKSTATMSAKLNVLKNNAQLALAELGGPLLDAATQGLKAIVPVVQKVAAGFSTLPGPVKGVAVSLIALGAVAGPLTKLATGIGKIGKAAFAAGKALAGATKTAVQFFTSGKASQLASSLLDAGKSVLAFGRNALVAAANIAKQTVALVAQKVAMVAGAVAEKALAAAQFLLNAAMTANPIGLIVVGIAALVAGAILAYKHFGPFRKAVDALGRAFLVVFNFVKRNWPKLLVILTGPIGIAVLLVTRNFDKIKAAVSAVFDFVKTKWPLLLAILTGPIGLAVLAFKTFGPKVLSAITTGFVAVVSFFTGLPARIVGALANVGTVLIETGKRIVGGLLTGAKAVLSAYLAFYIRLPILVVRTVGNAAVWLVQKGRDVIGGLLTGTVAAFGAFLNFFVLLPSRILAVLAKANTWLLDTGGRILAGLLTGAQNFAHFVFGFFGGLKDKIIGAIPAAIGWLYNAGRDVLRGFLQGLESIVGDVENWFTSHVKHWVRLATHPWEALSPSRLMVRLGHNIGDGLVVGLNHRRADIVKAFDVFKPPASLAEGIESGLPKVEKSLGKFSQAFKDVPLAFPEPKLPSLKDLKAGLKFAESVTKRQTSFSDVFNAGASDDVLKAVIKAQKAPLPKTIERPAFQIVAPDGGKVVDRLVKSVESGLPKLKTSLNKFSKAFADTPLAFPEPKLPSLKDFKAGLKFAENVSTGKTTFADVFNKGAPTDVLKAVVKAQKAPLPKAIERPAFQITPARAGVVVHQEINMRHDVATPAELEATARSLAWKLVNTGRRP